MVADSVSQLSSSFLYLILSFLVRSRLVVFGGVGAWDLARFPLVCSFNVGISSNIFYSSIHHPHVVFSRVPIPSLRQAAIV